MFHNITLYLYYQYFIIIIIYLFIYFFESEILVELNKLLSKKIHTYIHTYNTHPKFWMVMCVFIWYR